MVSSNKNIAVNAQVCGQIPCIESCAPLICQLCRPCLSDDDIQDLHEAYREHIRKGDTKRIYPKPILQLADLNTSNGKMENIDLLSPKNKMMIQWFAEKCKLDTTWCL